jgi:hypothetical protein
VNQSEVARSGAREITDTCGVRLSGQSHDGAIPMNSILIYRHGALRKASRSIKA